MSLMTDKCSEVNSLHETVSIEIVPLVDSASSQLPYMDLIGSKLLSSPSSPEVLRQWERESDMKLGQHRTVP